MTTPKQVTQVVGFIPVNPNANQPTPAPLAFDISVLNDKHFVDSITTEGECPDSKEFSNLADALEECVKRMRTQSHVEYTVE